MFVAQTNIQLYNQLRRENRTLEELHFVHRAYEFITTLYGGFLQSDGKPFLSHSTGVASIVSQLGAPIEVVVAGLTHNIYGNGDFGDGRSKIITNSRRKLVISALGERVSNTAVTAKDRDLPACAGQATTPLCTRCHTQSAPPPHGGEISIFRRKIEFVGKIRRRAV